MINEPFVQARCPLCRLLLVSPEEQSQAKGNWKEIVNSFPTDLAMASLVEAETILSQSHNCGVCEAHSVTFMCLDCSDMFCSDCASVHTKQKVRSTSILITCHFYEITGAIF